MLNRTWQGASHPAWLWDVWLGGRPHSLGNVQGAVTEGGDVADFLKWLATNFDRTVTWRDIDWVRDQWDGPILLKGVLDSEDAREARACGIQGLVVSNHGGRQLDGVRSSLSALPRIVQEVGADVEVLMDGGVRSGLDVLKALSLGAKACLVGRPWAYALAAQGGGGVSRLITLLRNELATAMVLTGCNRAADANDSLLDRC